METAYLLIDVGGTELKCGIADKSGRINMPLTKFPANAKAGREKILNHFAKVIKTLIKMAGDCEIAGVGMAFPGPFDYKRGISLMKGLDKYDSIYGIPLAAAIKEKVEEIACSKFVFLHDVEAFAVGESYFGPCREAERIFCLCIGTGAGSAFIENKAAVKDGADIPLNGWIYNTPFKESVIDDYISSRGIKKLSLKLLGRGLDGKSLYELCERGDKEAAAVFKCFGNDLKDAAMPFIKRFRPKAVVLGGQISGSFSFFGSALSEACAAENIDIYLEKDTSVKAMQGLYISIVQEGLRC